MLQLKVSEGVQSPYSETAQHYLGIDLCSEADCEYPLTKRGKNNEKNQNRKWCRLCGRPD